MPSSLTHLLTQAALAHHTKRFFNPTYAGLITSLTAEAPKSAKDKSSGREGTQSVSMGSRFGTTSNAKQDENEISTLRSQYSRFLPPVSTTPPSRHTFMVTVLEVLGKYYHIQIDKKGKKKDVMAEQDSERDWVYLVTPFICCLSRPAAMCLGFEKLMDRLGGHSTASPEVQLTVQTSSHHYPPV